MQLANTAVQYSLEGDEKAVCLVIVWRQSRLGCVACRQVEKRFSARNICVPREQFRFIDKVYGGMDDYNSAALAVQAVYSSTAETKLLT